MSLSGLLELMSYLIKNWDKVDQVISSIVAVVNSAIEKLKSIGLEKFELKQQLQECKESLDGVRSHADQLTASVKSLFEYAHLDDQTFEAMKRSIERNELKCVEDYLYLTNEYLTKTFNYYKNFLQAYEETKAQCRNMATEIERKRLEAKNKKTATRVLGGTAATVGLAGGIGGGIAASIAVGVFTAGIGTVIGLGITAAGAATAVSGGAGAGVTTYLAARHYRELERAFQNLCTDMDSLDADVSQLGRMMGTLETKLKGIRDNKDVVECSITRRVEPDALIRVLKNFLKQIKENFHSQFCT